MTETIIGYRGRMRDALDMVNEWSIYSLLNMNVKAIMIGLLTITADKPAVGQEEA